MLEMALRESLQMSAGSQATGDASQSACSASSSAQLFSNTVGDRPDSVPLTSSVAARATSSVSTAEEEASSSVSVSVRLGISPFFICMSHAK